MKKNLLFITSIAVFLAGCSFLDEYSKDKVFASSANDLDELILGDGYMNAEMSAGYDLGYGYCSYIHLMDDDAEETSLAQMGSSHGFNLRDPMFGYFTWQARPGVNETNSSFINESGDWNRIYGHINVVNSILDIVDDLGGTHSEQAQATRIKGEACFLRAAYHFTLVNLYGKPYNRENISSPGIPIKLVGEVIDIKYSRESVGTVYEQILADLKVAEACLAESVSLNTIYRADIVACYHLLSRVHLYMQNWSEALRYAQKVLATNGALRDLNGFNYETGFLSKTSPETIFSMGSSNLPCCFINQLKSFGVSHDLYHSYTAGDLRQEIFLYEYDGYVGLTKLAPAATQAYRKGTNEFWWYAYYYYGYYGKRVEVSDHFLFRSAEAYLNGAEAAAYLGDENTANRLLEQLRVNRIDAATYAPVNLSGEALVKFIRDERRRELCFEGHRWFDLRRYQVCEHYPESKEIRHIYYQYESRNSTTLIQKREYVLQPYDPAYTLAIPKEVLDFNTGMQNNERPERPATLLPF